MGGLIFAILTWVYMIDLWPIYLLLLIHATAFIIGQPSRNSLTPNLVARQDLPNALSVEFLGFQVGSLLGPILSGTMINHFGQSAAYLTFAGLFGIILLALIFMGHVPQEEIHQKSAGFDWNAIRKGINYTFTHP